MNNHELSFDDLVTAKFNGYCSRCYYSFWKKERVVKAGVRGFTHQDCGQAIIDRTPRRLNPKVESVIGKLDKSILKKKAKKMILANQS